MKIKAVFLLFKIKSPIPKVKGFNVFPLFLHSHVLSELIISIQIVNLIYLDEIENSILITLWINAQTKITEVWKAIKKDKNDNLFKNGVPKINSDERQSRSMAKGLLIIKGHTVGTQNTFINDGKRLWNKCPHEITQFNALHPPKALIKKFVKTLPL